MTSSESVDQAGILGIFGEYLGDYEVILTCAEELQELIGQHSENPFVRDTLAGFRLLCRMLSSARPSQAWNRAVARLCATVGVSCSVNVSNRAQPCHGGHTCQPRTARPRRPWRLS